MKAEFATLDSLRPDTTGHNLVVKVVSSKQVHSQASAAAGGQRQGSGAQRGRMAECLIGDASGVILLTARNEQVDSLRAGTYWTLRNAKVDMFRGSMRLALDQWSALEPAPEASFVPKDDYNLSLVEFELVYIAGAATSGASLSKSGGNSAMAAAEASA